MARIQSVELVQCLLERDMTLVEQRDDIGVTERMTAIVLLRAEMEVHQHLRKGLLGRPVERVVAVSLAEGCAGDLAKIRLRVGILEQFPDHIAVLVADALDVEAQLLVECLEVLTGVVGDDRGIAVALA